MRDFRFYWPWTSSSSCNVPLRLSNISFMNSWVRYWKTLPKLNCWFSPWKDSPKSYFCLLMWFFNCRWQTFDLCLLSTSCSLSTASVCWTVHFYLGSNIQMGFNGIINWQHQNPWWELRVEMVWLMMWCDVGVVSERKPPSKVNSCSKQSIDIPLSLKLLIVPCIFFIVECMGSVLIRISNREPNFVPSWNCFFPFPDLHNLQPFVALWLHIFG